MQRLRSDSLMEQAEDRRGLNGGTAPWSWKKAVVG